MKKINWSITKFESKRELVSSDYRWHVSESQKSDGTRELFLTNYDLLLAPNGSGSNHKECFETFIESCERYIERVRNIQQEVKEHMEAMLEATKEQGEMSVEKFDKSEESIDS